MQTFAFSLEEIKRIVDSAGEPYKTFYSILAETGIRGGEICALRVADLDLENAVIYVRQSVWGGQIQTVKSKKGNRRFPISAQLVEHIRAYLRRGDRTPLAWCLRPRMVRPGTRLGPQAEVSSAAEEAGIPQCGFHAFRHGNATLLDQIGAPMAVRQNRLGHAEAQTTMGYTHAVTADERRIAEELGKICTLLHGVNKRKAQHREC